MRHHRDALERFVALHRQDARVLGVIVTGSLARGHERVDSDVDVVVIVTEERFTELVNSNQVMRTESADDIYPGGYIDAKFASLALLSAVPDSGDDATRRSLREAEVAFDRSNSVAAALEIIKSLPHDPRRQLHLVQSFVGQARIHGEYFLPQGAALENSLLLHHAAVHLATSAARAVLAAGGEPAPGAKDLLPALRQFPGTPDALPAAIERLVRTPSPETAGVVLSLLEEHLGAALSNDSTLSRFVLDNELAWFTGAAPPEYR